MNFKTCLYFACDQQSQWGLCVLLEEQAQREGDIAAPSALFLPCYSVAEWSVRRKLSLCRGYMPAQYRAVQEKVEKKYRAIST